MTKELTYAVVLGVGGVIFSLLFSYLPGFAPWYEKQDKVKKQLVMLGCLVAATVGIGVAGCYGLTQYWGLPFTCDKSGFATLLMAFFVAVIANQGTHLSQKYIAEAFRRKFPALYGGAG
jgi:hypothetical protein